uniref:Uncharacterized protein n=1 Tax=Rhizophora mucronata TaxID=61149 RepID=A0A2P2J530_RHIMU
MYILSSGSQNFQREKMVNSLDQSLIMMMFQLQLYLVMVHALDYLPESQMDPLNLTCHTYS